MATHKVLRGKDTMKRRRWEKGHIKQVMGEESLQVYTPLASKGL